MPWSDGLSPEQRTVASHFGSHARLISGRGTGADAKSEQLRPLKCDSSVTGTIGNNILADGLYPLPVPDSPLVIR